MNGCQTNKLKYTKDYKNSGTKQMIESKSLFQKLHIVLLSILKAKKKIRD